MLNKRKLWSIGLGGLLLGATVLAGCGPTSGTGNTSTNSQKPKEGGSVVDAFYEEPDTFIPNLTTETYGVMADQALWAPLWYGDNSGTGHLLPGIATEVPSVSNGGISTDGKTYTIHLRSGLKWSDGTPETADDLAFSLNLYGNPAFANTAGFPTTDPSDPIGYAGATATDSTTVVVKFKNPAPTVLALLADGSSAPIPKEVFGKMDPASIAKSSQATNPTVVSGPFTLKSYQQGASITLVKNKNYYQGPTKPYLDQLTLKIIPDSATILTALQSGGVDASWFLDYTKLSSYKALQGYNLFHDTHPANYEAIYFNLTNPILSDPQVRKAITMTFDTSPIIQTTFQGYAQKTCDAEPGTFAHEPSLIPCYTTDATAAGKLLDSDGWTMGSDGFRHKNGQTLTLRWSTTSNNQVRAENEQIGQAQLKKVGINIQIKNYPARQFFATSTTGVLCSGNFDIGEFTETLGYDPDNHTLFSSDQLCDKNGQLLGGSNYMHYSNSTVDQAEQTQLSNPNQSVRKQAFDTINKQILADNPLMFMYSSETLAAYKTTLHNYAPSPNGPSELWNVWDWWTSAS